MAATNGSAESERPLSVRGPSPLLPLQPNSSVDKAADYANYFCTYAFLYHQKEMLSDRVRMDAYYNAIFRNKKHFTGKIVLDVGTGSGILAIWAAQAGAKKVYAVEATKMAQHARDLAKGNGVQDIVEVIEASIEDVNLPEKVDLIISEWMGYFLVRESMFDSVIHARDRWIKPTGVMYPSQARMWLAPIRSNVTEIKMHDYENAMADWYGFSEDMLDQYGVDMSNLNEPYDDEQRRYYLQTSLWNNLYPNQVIGRPAVIKEFDCHSTTLNDIGSVQSNFSISISTKTKCCGFAGWFDVHFRGSKNDAVDHEILLTTAPSVHHTTHWGQQIFLLDPPVDVDLQDVLEGTIHITRSKENHRLMDVKIMHNLKRFNGETTPTVTSCFYIE